MVITNEILHQMQAQEGPDQEGEAGEDGKGAGESRSGSERGDGADKDTEIKFDTFVKTKNYSENDSKFAYFDDLSLQTEEPEDDGENRNFQTEKKNLSDFKKLKKKRRSVSAEKKEVPREPDLKQICVQKLTNYVYSHFGEKKDGQGTRIEAEHGERQAEEDMREDSEQQVEQKPDEKKAKSPEEEEVQREDDKPKEENPVNDIYKKLSITNKKDLNEINRIRDLELQNANLESENKILRKKNAELQARVQKLESENSEHSKACLELESQNSKIESELESAQKKIELLEKEVSLYKNKKEEDESKIQMLTSTHKKAEEFQQMLEGKNKRIIELEVELKNFRLKQNKSMKQISRSERGNFEVSPLSLIWDAKEQPKPKPLAKVEPVAAKRVRVDPGKNQKNEKKGEVGSGVDEKNKAEKAEVVASPVTLFPVTTAGLEDTSEREKMVENSKQVAESRMAEKAPENTLFAKKKLPEKDKKQTLLAKKKSEETSKEEARKPSYFFKKPKNQGINSRINKKSKELKQMIKQGSVDLSVERNILHYDHDHLNIVKNRRLAKIVEKKEKINIEKLAEAKQFSCFSDNAYRLNKWKNKKEKYLIVTKKYLYIVTPPKELKRALKLTDILQIKTRGNKDNFICFVTTHKNDEMLENFKKNELLLFLFQIIRKQKLNITIRPNVESFLMLNTSNKNVVIDPAKLTKFKPIYNNTFNYASRNNRLMNLYIYKEGVFVSENYQKKVGLIVDLGILIFSMVRWKLEKFVPFGGRSGAF